MRCAERRTSATKPFHLQAREAKARDVTGARPSPRRRCAPDAKERRAGEGPRHHHQMGEGERLRPGEDPSWALGDLPGSPPT